MLTAVDAPRVVSLEPPAAGHRTQHALDDEHVGAVGEGGQDDRSGSYATPARDEDAAPTGQRRSHRAALDPDPAHVTSLAAAYPRRVIRAAAPGDVDTLVGLVRDLAEYEQELAQVELTPALLHEALFGTAPSAGCLVAEEGGAVVGFALHFRTFSTWTGVPGLWLEDLYVDPAARRRGHARALLAALAAHAREHGQRRVDWSVLDWNTSAQEFYASLGAVPLAEWTTHRLTGDPLRRLADEGALGSGP